MQRAASDWKHPMTDHSPNDQFHAQAFMDGANADYIDQLAARHAAAEAVAGEEQDGRVEGLGCGHASSPFE